MLSTEFAKPMTKSSPNYRVPALEKGLDILETLAVSPAPLTLSEIAEQLDRSTSELYRILNCLVGRDYLSKSETSGRYALTLRLYEMAHTHPPVMILLRAAQGPMRRLALSLRESVHLSVIRQGRLLVLEQVESPEKVRVSLEVGETFSLIDTSSGRLLLAALGVEQCQAVLTDSDEYHALTSDEQDTLHARLQAIRETWVSSAVDETYIGIQDTAVLIGTPESQVTAALAVTRLTARHTAADTTETIEQLQTCANTITKNMGLNTYENHINLF